MAGYGFLRFVTKGKTNPPSRTTIDSGPGNAHKCGQYWLKTEGHKECGMCQNYNTIESTQHIIFNCEAIMAGILQRNSAQRKALTGHKGFDITSIVALPLFKIRSPNGTPSQAQRASCLFPRLDVLSSDGNYDAEDSLTKTKRSVPDTDPLVYLEKGYSDTLGFSPISPHNTITPCVAGQWAPPKMNE